MLGFFGLNFHYYGLIVGMAIIVSWSLFRKRAVDLGYKSAEIERISFWLAIGGLVGARFWHVFTDWPIYVGNFSQIWQFWTGGLSILGAIAGMVLSLYLTIGHNKVHLYRWLDILAFALPIGQALGRLANWVNQELYGWPTNLPWGLSIDVAHRVSGYESATHFHPLFAYEAVAMAVFGFLIILLFWQSKKMPPWFNQLGLNQIKMRSGSLFFGYLLYYSVIRFGLDFLRIDVSPVIFGLNINQIILSLVIWGILGWWFKQKWAKIFLLAWIALIITGHLMTSQQVTMEYANSWLDHSIQELAIDDQTLRVEIVKSPESIQQGLGGRMDIGSDGMLFILPEKSQANFWMKDMIFDLDLVWLADNRVVGITPNIPHPDQEVPDFLLKVYTAPQPVDMVLEVPAGYAAWQGWAIDDLLQRVTIPNYSEK